MGKFAEQLERLERVSGEVERFLELLDTATALRDAARERALSLEAEVDRTQSEADAYREQTAPTALRAIAARSVPEDVEPLLREAFVDAVAEAAGRRLLGGSNSLRFRAITASQNYDKAINELQELERDVSRLAREHRDVLAKFKKLREEFEHVGKGQASATVGGSADQDPEAPSEECAQASGGESSRDHQIA